MALAELAIFRPAWPCDGISKSQFSGFMSYGTGCSFMAKLVCSQYQASKSSGLTRKCHFSLTCMRACIFFQNMHLSCRSYLVHGRCYITAMTHTQHCQSIQA